MNDAAALQRIAVEASTRQYEYARKLEVEVEKLVAALTDLVGQVEMAESVGICLPNRVPALNALAALVPSDRNTTEARDV